MEFFVDPQSVVRKIWGKSDTILFVFAGASAEFALNRAVDWLYFTGRLPADPLGRLFSTVLYARKIVFSQKQEALLAIDQITRIHQSVEKNRGDKIPDWAYRDVLFMLIHYSKASFELLERKLTDAENEELFDVFYRMGQRMNLPDLPRTYPEWLQQQKLHLERDLVKSNYTDDLFKQYRKHLGFGRYLLLTESQKLVCPPRVLQLLNAGRIPFARPVIWAYKLSRQMKMDSLVKALILPAAYKTQIEALDRLPA